MNTPRRVALITGAASGLGASFAECLARDSFDLVLVDRNSDQLQETAERIARNHGVTIHPMVQDLTHPEAVTNISRQCDDLKLPIDFLVNNAGHHLNKLMHELTWPVIEANLRILLNVVVEMTHRFLPGMIQRKWGRVINVSSVSGFMPGGIRLATYNATKTFLIPFTEALNFELEGTGVQLTAVCPGFMRTNLFINSGLTDVRDTVPGFMWLESRQVAQGSVSAVMRGASVYVPGLINRMIVTAAKFVPRRLLRERTRILHRSAHSKMASVSHATVEKSLGRRVALVTGASSGIGASFCDVLASEGFNIILVARREKELQQKATALAERHGIETRTIIQDLTDPSAIDLIGAKLQEIGWPVDILVNNAGYPTTALFHNMAWTEVDAVLRIYLESVVKLTHALVPAMIRRGWGRVINVASLAAFEPGSYRSSLYSSAKAFQVAISESLAAELEGTGVFVTAVCPGFTTTEWMTKNKVKPSSIPAALWMESDDVARIGLKAAMRGTPVIIVATPCLRIISTLFQIAPRRLIGFLLSRKRRKITF